MAGKGEVTGSPWVQRGHHVAEVQWPQGCRGCEGVQFYMPACCQGPQCGLQELVARERWESGWGLGRRSKEGPCDLNHAEQSG